MRAFALSLALTCLSAGAALAQPQGNSLTLQDPSKAPTRVVIVDGAAWKCSAGVCMASGGKAQAADRACRRVVAKVGAVSAFTWQGETLSADALAACNAVVVASK
jgi:ribosomal protein S27E